MNQSPIESTSAINKSLIIYIILENQIHLKVLVGHAYCTNSLNGSGYKYLQKPKYVQKQNLKRTITIKPHSLVALEHLKLRRKLRHQQLFLLVDLGCLQQGEELNLLTWKKAFAYFIGFLCLIWSASNKERIWIFWLLLTLLVFFCLTDAFSKAIYAQMSIVSFCASLAEW